MAKKRDGTTVSTGHILFGKIPPQAVDVEEIILGALLLEKDSYPAINGTLKPEMFYKAAHQYVYSAIQLLHDKGEAVDLATVCNQLKIAQNLEAIGGPYGLTLLTQRVASAANINFHVAIVKQMWIKREMIHMAMTIVDDGYDDGTDCFATLIKGQEFIDHISQSLDGKRIRNLKELAWEVKQEVITRAGSNEIPGLSTGFRDLDETIGGLMKSDLIIIAARAGMGKTSFVAQIALHIAKQPERIVIMFSLEMKDKQIVMRMIANEGKINTKNIFLARLDYEQMKIVENVNLNYENFILDDTAGINIHQLRSRVMKTKAKHGRVDLIVIDYLQLMTPLTDKETRDEQLGEVTRGLKQIAKDFDVPVIALSQLSREVEKRSNHRPVLSDLRSSGNIEQDADTVWFIFRPDYYDLSENPNREALTGLASVIIAKHRNGELKDVKMRFIKEHVRFENLEPKREIVPEQEMF